MQTTSGLKEVALINPAKILPMEGGKKGAIVRRGTAGVAGPGGPGRRDFSRGLGRLGVRHFGAGGGGMGWFYETHPEIFLRRGQGWTEGNDFLPKKCAKGVGVAGPRCVLKPVEEEDAS